MLYLLAFILSLWTVPCWLGLPLIIQVVVDRAFIRGDAELLMTLGWVSGVVLLVAFVLEWGLVFLKARLDYRHVSLIGLELCIQLPRILISLVSMFIYLRLFGFVSLPLVSLSGVIYVFIGRITHPKTLIIPGMTFSSIEALLGVLARFLLSSSSLCFFYFGANFLIQGAVTFGQLLAFSLIHIYISCSVLNLATVASYRKRKVQPSIT